MLKVTMLVGIGEEDVACSADSATDRSIKNEDSVVKWDDGSSEEGGHVLFIEGKLTGPMWESKDDGLGIGVPSCQPFICCSDDLFCIIRVCRVFPESECNSFRHFVSLDFIDRS